MLEERGLRCIHEGSERSGRIGCEGTGRDGELNEEIRKTRE